MNQESQIKSLKRKVNVLVVLFALSMGTSIWAGLQVRHMADKLPDYHELKEDVKTLQTTYDNTKDKAHDVYDNAVDGVENAYDNTKNKVNEYFE